MATNRAEMIVRSIEGALAGHEEAGTPAAVILVREEDWQLVQQQRAAMPDPDAIGERSYRGFQIGFSELDGDEISIIEANAIPRK